MSSERLYSIAFRLRRSFIVDVTCLVVLTILLPLDMTINRARRNTQQTRGHVLIATGVLQRDVDRLALEFAQRGADFERKRVTRLCEGGNSLGEHRQRDLFAIREDDCPLDGILQLTDITRPVVSREGEHGFF